MTIPLNITSYDPVDLKASLIEFMSSTPEFKDYEYREGSTLNTILDILVRNTHYISYQANMNATESFLDSAQLRTSIVSHAQKLSYFPKSRTATTVNVSIQVTPSDINNDSSIRVDKGSVFLHRAGNTLYSFTNTDDIILNRVGGGMFSITNTELKQGTLLTRNYFYDRNIQSVELLYPNMDTSTLRVFVSNGTAGVRTEYTLVKDITDVKPGSYVFYLSENHNGNYEIEFGKGVLGNEPSDMAQITIEFVNTEPQHANGLTELFAAKPINGYSNIQVDVVGEGFGGAERATLDSIKFLAPRLYAAQNRAVIESDYQSIILREFPFIKAVRVWGGEKNDPPYYGRVMIAAIPQEGYIISDSVKRVIETSISKFNVTGIRPMLVDSTFIGLDLYIKYLYDNKATTATNEQIRTTITNTVNVYNEQRLGLFDFWYNNSELIRSIYDIPAITSVEIDKVLYVEVPVTLNVKRKYEFNFSNKIIPNTLAIRGELVFDLVATSTKVRDDGSGKVWLDITKYDITNSLEVGTIDYETGKVELDLLILSSDSDRIVVEVKTEDDNVYTSNNQVVEIEGIFVSPLDAKV